MRRILVIKLGALGDFVLAFGPFAAIRAAHGDVHRGAEITLLTTAPFAPLAERAPWFDRVVIDRRAPWWKIAELWRLARLLRGFDFVYDLQTSARSASYFLLAGRPPWSGIARGASHPHANPARNRMHTLERQREQLAMAGIGEFPPPDLAWLKAGGRSFDLPHPYALLVPGAAAHRPAKRWPAARFASLTRHLAAAGFAPVLIGAAAERALGEAIRAEAPEAIDLIGRTELPDLGPIAAGAALAVGNDTGPMHLIAALGTPVLVLFSSESDPALTAPRGPEGEPVSVLTSRTLADLPLERVVEALPSPHRREPDPEQLSPCLKSASPTGPSAASTDR
ncbi:MAG TPA: glycosyltransferase family 9 protein [Acetobacteraceae bacterium]|nr:glycosyltransferase family 9 protein [Acetobacteraceae bacterium]